MSRLTDMFVLGQRIGVAAKEESSRYDLPQVDVDHVLLALLVGGGPAGEVLRGQGLTLDAARGATEQVRAQHIARLGIVPPAADPRPIHDPSLGDIEWTRRAMKVVSGNEDGSELGLLAGLLDEPSRLVAEVLGEAGIDPGAVRVALAEARASAGPRRPVGPTDPDWPAVTHTGFALGDDRGDGATRRPGRTPPPGLPARAPPADRVRGGRAGGVGGHAARPAEDAAEPAPGHRPTAAGLRRHVHRPRLELAAPDRLGSAAPDAAASGPPRGGHDDPARVRHGNLPDAALSPPPLR